MHKYDKALINYQLTVHFDPRCAEAYNNMGVIFKEQENLEKALKYYHLAIQCNPRFAQTLNNLGVAYTTSGRLTEALEYLSRAIAVAPNYAEAYNNLGWLFWDHGDLAQALRMYERCIELSPNSKNPSQNRLLALNYLHGVSSDLVFQAHSAWAERFCREVGSPYTSWPNPKVPQRQLRIGYISPDFFHHSVSFFVHALLEHANKEQFEIYIYSNATREDDKTEVFKSIVPVQRWRKVVGMPAVEVCEVIRADQIDILVELAGHTANNRLDVIALKPAPVQITYIGYNNTTGFRGQKASLLLVGRIFFALAAGSIQAVGTGIGEANWPNRCIWAILWLMTLCSTIGFVTAVLLGSDHGDLVQASIMSFAYVWIGFIWAAMYGRKRWNGEEVAWFKTKIASGLVLALLFWIFPLLEPTYGTTGHWNCYKSCPLGGPGLPYFIFTALLGAIDYRLVDDMVDPLDTTQPFSEELVRMPGCFLCYTPPARIPEIEELPALRHGVVTFGSFSCLAKVGDPVVALWARCLHEVPNSRLLVKNKGFYSPDVQ
eukprot:symbB.v1.2.015572.t2/scaffold1168.1/size134142/1